MMYDERYKKMKKRYNHAFTIAFSVETDNDRYHVTKQELLIGLIERFNNLLKEEDDIIVEACGLPYDTEDNEDYDDGVIDTH